MVNVFDRYTGSGSLVRNGEQETGTISDTSSALNVSGDPDPIGSVQMLERAVIYGPDLRTTIVPRETAASSPVVTFKSSFGIRFGMNDELLSKHLLMLGGTGMGKSNTFYQIIRQLMTQLQDDAVMVIFDTKGDYYRKFYDRDNPNHILIGNEEIYRDISPVWNLYDEVLDFAGGTRISSLEVRLKELAAHLFRGRESQTQPFFHLAAADLFVKFAIDYVRTHKLVSTQRLISALKCTDAKKMLEMIDRNPEFASARSYLGDPGKMTAQALGILAYLNSMISDLFVGIFAENRATGQFSMRKLVHEGKKKVIFLEYDLSVGEVLDPMYSLLIDLALKEAMTRQEDGKPHLYLVVDEFKLLPDLQHIENALNYGRSKGIRVFAGIQSVSQVYEVYGEDKGKSILSGFMNCFAFKTIDRESREYISERFGKNYSNITYSSGTNYYSVQREGYAVEDWNIVNLGIGDAYIDILGYPPFRFHFSEYR